MLSVDGLTAGYGRTMVVNDISFTVAPGQVVAILGPNGAGKTTTLRAIVGDLKCRGNVRLDDTDLDGLPTHRRAMQGLVLVPQERNLFPTMTVTEHLELAGAVVARRDGRAAVRARVGETFDLLADLVGKADTPARSLSGGQQQMLAIARALIAAPDYLLLDEPLGLAPLVVAHIMTTLRTLADAGKGVVLVEQQAAAALRIADDVIVLTGGAVRMSGPASDFDPEGDLAAIYLGGAA